ncbi:uncharacterized protein LOC114945674 [Nylanderia fulva]|nr:uncharacterized protein LOC114945674 [Nylanderia fulva]
MQFYYAHTIKEIRFSEDVNFIETFLHFLIVRQVEVGTDKCITDRFNEITWDVGDKKLPLYYYTLPLTNIDECIAVLYHIVKLLLSFPYIPKIYGGTTDYLNGILLMILVILERSRKLQLSRRTYLLIQTLKKHLRLYWFRIFTQCTRKHIATIFKSLIPNDIMAENVFFEYLVNWVKLDCNMIPELREKMRNVLIACREIHN